VKETLSGGTSEITPVNGQDVGRLELVIRHGELVIDVRNFLARIGDRHLPRRLRKFQLLVALTSRPERLLNREELADIVWGRRHFKSSRTIDVHVVRLRTALAKVSSQEYVQTVRGFGYRFLSVEEPRARATFRSGDKPARTLAP
jgi:DNA-binding response OmpR family regulator